jgi:hypothetical protein
MDLAKFEPDILQHGTEQRGTDIGRQRDFGQKLGQPAILAILVGEHGVTAGVIQSM